MTTTTRAAPPASAWARARTFLEAIKFEHSVFALPFAIASAFLVGRAVPPAADLVWVIVAMVSGRTFAMGANRLIDAEIDARNPRTARRALPAGLISKRDVFTWLIAAAAVFAIAVSQLDRLAWALAPVVLAVMSVYPYGKRFTWLCHYVLGIVYLMVPPAVSVALTGELTTGVTLLGAGAMLWVSGFDILYATADVAVDRAQGLKSVPARFGIPAALWAARATHAGAIVLISAAGVALDAGPVYYAGAVIAGMLLAYENSLVRPSDLSKLNMAFFTMNGIIAVVFGTFASIDAVVF